MPDGSGAPDEPRRVGRRGRRPDERESVFGAIAVVVAFALSTVSALAVGIRLDLLEPDLWLALGPIQLIWAVPLSVHARARRKRTLLRTTWIAVVIAMMASVVYLYGRFL